MGRGAGPLLALAAALWLAALRPGAEPPPACARPGELTARAGHTVAVGCGGGAPLRGPARLLFGKPLDLNRADAATLEALPGIGPARAAAIVAERARRRFERVESLTRVRGIGPRTLAALRPYLAVPGGLHAAGPG